MTNPTPVKPHIFSRSELVHAKHAFEVMIKKYFGEIWHIKSDGEYKAVDWYCRSPLLLDTGLWYLIQGAVHRGAVRAAGQIEVKDSGSAIRFILMYEPVKPSPIIKPH